MPYRRGYIKELRLGQFLRDSKQRDNRRKILISYVKYCTRKKKIRRKNTKIIEDSNEPMKRLSQKKTRNDQDSNNSDTISKERSKKLIKEFQEKKHFIVVAIMQSTIGKIYLYVLPILRIVSLFLKY